MGIIKFFITFFFFYYAIKIIRSVFFVTKTIRNVQNGVRKSTPRAGKQDKSTRQPVQDDIIDAQYKVIEEE